MNLRTECKPILSVDVEGNKTTYTRDRTRFVNLKVKDREKGVVECPFLSTSGKCDGKFRCVVNEVDMFTTVIPTTNNK